MGLIGWVLAAVFGIALLSEWGEPSQTSDVRTGTTLPSASTSQGVATSPPAPLVVLPVASFDPVGWIEQRSHDDLSGKDIVRSTVTSENSLDLRFPYHGENRGRLTVRLHPRWGTDVLVQVDKGQITCSFNDCYVTVRFDEANPSRFGVSRSQDHSSDVVFINDTKRFIERAKKAKVIVVELTMYDAGAQALRFETEAPLVWPLK